MKVFKAIVLVLTVLALTALVHQPDVNLNDIPNRLPEAAPYNYEEAKALPPPYEEHWAAEDNPGQCKTCHQKIFDEWNGSMMSNSWRDPAWRAAFFLLSRAVSAHGECDILQPPDGTEKEPHNPFANQGECSSTFDIGAGKYTVSRPGSLLDGFCSRCHMPTNYADNFNLRDIKMVPVAGGKLLEHATLSPNFFPTSDNDTGIAYAQLDAQFRNTDTGRSGIICAVCHTTAETRDTPYHNYERSESSYTPVADAKLRTDALPADKQDIFNLPDKSKMNLGYSIGAGAFRMSPNAIVMAERFGPLVANTPPTPNDHYTGEVFKQDYPYQHMDTSDPSKHKGFHQVMFTRAEMCAACHDVTNALPIKNKFGHWVGGFPIERTYTEWANSAYADRPGNTNFKSEWKRDCQTCHMQQEYGQPGTAQTLYDSTGKPLPPPSEAVANDGAKHPFYSHHFVGGNSYITRLIGKDVDQTGNPEAWPELSAFSFSSADHKSVYSRGFWTHTERKGAYSQQQRMAWDRMRHVLSMDLRGPATVQPGASAPLSIAVQNTGSGHKFPTGFPEGRTAWLAVHAYDLATGKELQIHDNVWNRDSVGIGNLTTEELEDPNFPGCKWMIPAGSADPYSVQFKAVATLGVDRQGKSCPTLDLPYAQPLNIKTNSDELPLDDHGNVINEKNPGMEVFVDKNGNGDHYDDSYLRDSRIYPRGNDGNVAKVDRYSIVVPPGTQGPIAVTSAVYYQSFEAIVALKFLGNMADTNNNFILEPCVLGGLCDGRKPNTEPPVVEGAPPVPMTFRTFVIDVAGATPDKTAPKVGMYPLPGAAQVYQDAVVKVFFSKPVSGVDRGSFTLVDSHGATVPGMVDQVGEGAWGFFPQQIILNAGEKYTAKLKAGTCDQAHNCTTKETVWSFTVAKDANHGSGDTTIPIGFPRDFATSAPPSSVAPTSVAHRQRQEKTPQRIAMK